MSSRWRLKRKRNAKSEICEAQSSHIPHPILVATCDDTINIAQSELISLAGYTK